jgi:hypothetical protein
VLAVLVPVAVAVDTTVAVAVAGRALTPVAVAVEDQHTCLQVVLLLPELVEPERSKV